MAAEPLRVCLLGGSLHHPGGLEAFCARAEQAFAAHSSAVRLHWLPTDTAYFRPRRAGSIRRRFRALADARAAGLDLVWLQYSTLLDLLFVARARALGVPVLVTPHLGANSRLQRSGLLRRLSVRLLARADGIALLFAGQERDVALPAGVPRTVIRTFLPAAALAEAATDDDGPLRLIHAGRLSAAKGSFLMVELCTALCRAGTRFAAAIIGRAEPDDDRRLRAAAAALAPDLTVAGWADEGELLVRLRASDALVHLSRIDSFPLIVLEALAAGALPVVLDLPGAAAMVAGYDGLVVSGDAAVADAAAWLSAQPLAELRARGAVAGQRVRADYAWSECVARAEAAFRGALTPAG